MFSSRIYSVSAFLKKLAPQSCHFSGTTRKLNKVSLYLQRAKFIDSISPLTGSALYLVETLKKVKEFSHSQDTLHALAKILAKSGQIGKLEALIDAINAGKFVNVAYISFMDRMRWYAEAGDLSSVTGVWDEWRRTLDKHPCTESYNIVMKLCIEKGKDAEAVKVFCRMIEEGALPNCRTYTVIIQHLLKFGKLDSAVEVFQMLPLMRIRRTLKQYSMLVEAFTGADRLNIVTTLLSEMQADGILPGRAMLLSLQRMKEAGFADETEELIREMMPDERIKSIGYSMVSPEDDVDDEDEGAGSHLEGNKDDVQLKPWLDPAALASTLKHWEPEEVSALEDANFLWTSRLVCKLIRCFKSPETAWQFFCWVAHQPGFVHDIYTISRMITKLARHGCVQLVDQLLCKVRHEGMILSLSTIRLIIDFYGFSRKGDAALSIFHNVKTICGPLSKSSLLILYSSLLRTLAKCQMNTEASDILEEMILLGICLDLQTFSGLMHHYALQGDIKTVQRLFGMVRQSGLEPDAYMYKILVCAYCKCERASLALRIFEDMRNSRLMPDAATKQLLVKSLWKEGKLREAAQVEEISEETCDNIPLALPGHLYTVSTADLIRVYKMYSCTEFTWSAGSPLSCETYVTYRARQPYSDLGSISDLFGISRMDIASASSLASENLSLFPDQLLLIPIKCTSNGTHYYSNINYGIKKDDSFYSVSIKLFQNLTNYYVVEEMNPMLNPNNLTIGVEVVFPLLCKCLKKSYTEKGIRYLITYVWQPGDQILPVSTMFNASASDIVMENNNRNFSAATCLPVLIPVKSPILSQLFPSSAANRKSKHHWVLIAISSAIIALLIVFSGLVACFHILYKKKKTLARNVFSLETSDLIRAYKVPKGEPFEPKTIQDKVLPGVSGYLGKLIVYDLNVIMKATMNLSERYRIGGSVYKAMINDQVLAVKKTRDATEELQILQRVSHANLVKLMGVSSDDYGNFYIVYEYVENRSLDKWLSPKVSASSARVESLSWNQRLLIALDIANGLQYLHEHSQPTRPATCSIMLNIDVFSFGVVLLELLSGKKVMETKDNGEVVMLWKEVKEILDIEDQRTERLRRWMDPFLKSTYSIDDALSLAILARACTSEKSSERPRMAEIVFNLCVLIQSSPQISEKSWVSKFDAEEVFPVISPVIAR
ncbi:Pentatricopeptide repeat-containing protein [Sesamum angolense]|uniref:Pentatricopeptide repeat-containing protein n=1 Tax=Sesamum angolense TaxID=2727404 RepID=A0AAE1XD56_9LAMI|nr:Pentatricopeptide repeat-containing protein [Sesamum angolense]